MNKKLLYSVPLVAVGLLLTSLPVSASAFPTATPTVQKQTPEQLVNQMFSGAKDTDKVLKVGDGYTFGKIDEKDIVTGKTITYDAKTDPKSITVKEAKEKELEKAKLAQIQSITKLTNDRLRFSSPPTKYWGLHNDGKPYVSGGWGGAGWQYAGYLFYNTSGHSNMLWKSVGDTARVGDQIDMENLYHYDRLGGIVVKSGVWTKVISLDSEQTLSYYSYYPAVNSHYEVLGQ